MFHAPFTCILFVLLTLPVLNACTEGGKNQTDGEQQVTVLIPTREADDHLDMNLDHMAMDMGESVLNLLEPYLPIPNCVAYYDGECMVYQNESDQDRCSQWGEIINPPPISVVSDINTCALEDIPSSNLQKAQDYLNLVRSWLQLTPIVMRQTLLQQQCALINWIDIVFSSRSPCFSNALAQASPNCSTLIIGGWTSLEMLELTLSLSVIPLRLAGLERRHLYYSEKLSQISVGRYMQSESISLELDSLTQSTQPYSLYPGVGGLPFEMVNEGNQLRSTVPWSIALPLGQTRDFDYEITQLRPTNRQLEINKNNSFSSSNIFVFDLGHTIREGDAYKVDMTWSNDEGRHTAQAYVAFNDCGYTIPNRNCNPLEESPCTMPGYNCIPNPSAEQWICTRQGPARLDEECQRFDGCQQGLRCHNNRCLQYCDPRSNQWNSCDELCQKDYHLETHDSLNFGLCKTSSQ